MKKDLNYKIGYQGIEGSWSEAALVEFIKKLNLSNVEMVPLVTSDKVGEQLSSGEIDYGVMAIDNSIGGTVDETTSALDKYNLIEVAQLDLEIHHCLFKRKDVLLKDIKKVASHEQAIKQTKKIINKKLNNPEFLDIDDTALAAKFLAENKLSSSTAVICSEQAGSKHGLELIAKIISNDKNITKFILLKNS